MYVLVGWRDMRNLLLALIVAAALIGDAGRGQAYGGEPVQRTPIITLG
jgi:hypothetical protein